mmetsp:Transcript_19262/g.60260  ORF Transcript_19262/g.60260 Transcript_19262/m.60260 type:complete len:277 (-) Transcript_19262:41-871(-)
MCGRRAAVALLSWLAAVAAVSIGGSAGDAVDVERDRRSVSVGGSTSSGDEAFALRSRLTKVEARIGLGRLTDERPDDAFHVVYFACLMMEWEEVCRKSHAALVRSGILEDESCKAVYVVFTGPGEHVKTVKQIFRHDKIVFEYMGGDVRSHEHYGIKKIKDLSTRYPRDKLLYFHSKGVTRRASSEDWVSYMEYFILDKYADCLKRLNDHDVVGTEYLARPRHHISGNFWWAKSSHVSNLVIPFTHDRRHAFEWFILSNELREIKDGSRRRRDVVG